MAVEIRNVRAVAGLARLALGPAEEERLTGELNRILEYMEKLNELDTEGVEPTSHVVPMSRTFREDEVDPFPARDELLKSAPQREDGYFKVPRIIE
jgi:aspartyl-tRNA(Asn)/glutamyl-tRNA(Gln) amidotransferase subunit C